VSAPPETLYRDDRPGAEARRDALLATRRQELAALPPAYARVFARRVGRAAAGGVAVLLAAGLCTLSVTHARAEALVGWLADGGSLRLLGIMAIAVAYAVGTLVAERGFHRSLERSLEPTGDPYTDLDRLAIGPASLAQRLLQRADRWSLALAIAGAATLVPFLRELTFDHDGCSCGWDNEARALGYELSDVGPIRALVNVVALGAAIVVGRRVTRASRSRWTPICHIAGVTSAVVLIGHGQPRSWEVADLVISVGMGVATSFVIAGSLAMWLRRRELGILDRAIPSPAPEVREDARLEPELARVYAGRAGRGAMGAVALVIAVTAAVLARSFAHEVAVWRLPWIEGAHVGPALFLAASASVLLAAYLIGAAIGRAVFARRNRSARALVREVDRPSAWLVIAGAAAFSPIVAVVVAARVVPVDPDGFGQRIEAQDLFTALQWLAFAVAIAVAGAIAICDVGRLPRWALLARPLALVLGITLGLVAGETAAGTIRSMRSYGTIEGAELAVLATFGVTAVLLVATWAVLAWRRREHSRLGITDP
jgi:hypothetical protein